MTEHKILPGEKFVVVCRDERVELWTSKDPDLEPEQVWEVATEIVRRLIPDDPGAHMVLPDGTTWAPDGPSD